MNVTMFNVEEDLLDHHAEICRALADPKRIMIMYALEKEPRHVTALAEYLGMPQSTVSRHLQILRQQFLVTGKRDGPSVVYQLADHRIVEVLDAIQQLLKGALARRSQLAEALVTK